MNSMQGTVLIAEEIHTINSNVIFLDISAYSRFLFINIALNASVVFAFLLFFFSSLASSWSSYSSLDSHLDREDSQLKYSKTLLYMCYYL